ncbi:RNase H domain-containing protein [Trichonephila clavata]|uniref:RNase H domain-containing protein n=1 Tax=Trichonephila clavata TaxID=2740835 RepID=A0A8X6KF95_TRICU|nr:RNase H domain-containing protein [Trichonephila clavata]
MLVSNGVSINTIPEIANTLVETFAKTSSCDNYTPAFQALKRREEKTTINNFTKWAEQNGFVFSTEKTVSVVFSRKRGVFPNPELFIGRSFIKVVKEFKFLGLIFDQSLRFHHHLKDFKIRSAKALNILKVLTNTCWEAERTSLLRLYRALIRSKLDYGSVVYSSACKSLLKILDPVHHQGLRLCLGAFHTSPVESLYAEAYEPPLDLRRKYLCLNHFMKIQSMKTNTAYSYLFNFNLYDFNSHCSFLTYSQPFHFRIRDLINDLNLNIGRIALCKISEVPPWKVIYPKVDFTLSCYSKACTPTPCQPFKAFSLHSSSHPILVDITYALANHLKKKDIRFCWIPGQAGITVNELADTTARSATGSSERSAPRPASNVPARAPPQQPAPVAQAPPPMAAPQQPGMFAQMATTAAGVAVGSAVGHTIGHALTGGMGGGSAEAAAPAAAPAPAQAAPAQGQNPCAFEFKQFLECTQNQSDISLCQGFNEVFRQCQQANGLSPHLS